MSMREALKYLKEYCETNKCNKCKMFNKNTTCVLQDKPETYNIDFIIETLEIQEKAPRKRKKPIPTIELAIQVVADMERGTSFCTAYRRLNLPEAKLRIVINSDKELLARYKKAILITKIERQKKYWKG